MLDREDCLAANSRSTGPQQQNTDDQNCSADSAERSTSADWQTADVDDQQRRPLVCSCPPDTTEPFHEDIDTTGAIAERFLLYLRQRGLL